MTSSDLFGRASRADDGVRSIYHSYATPAWMTRSLLEHMPSIAGSRALECCSGDDAITHVLRNEGECDVWTNDIDRLQPAQTHFDVTDWTYWEKQAPPVDWVITNVPFDVGFAILQHAVRHPRRGTVFLLRKTFLEPTLERGHW